MLKLSNVSKGHLAIGFVACFLLLGYVRHSVSYDRPVPARAGGQPILATSVHIHCIGIDVRIGFINGQ